MDINYIREKMVIEGYYEFMEKQGRAFVYSNQEIVEAEEECGKLYDEIDKYLPEEISEKFAKFVDLQTFMLSEQCTMTYELGYKAGAKSVIYMIK